MKIKLLICLKRSIQNKIRENALLFGSSLLKIDGLQLEELRRSRPGWLLEETFARFKMLCY